MRLEIPYPAETLATLIALIGIVVAARSGVLFQCRSTEEISLPAIIAEIRFHPFLSTLVRVKFRAMHKSFATCVAEIFIFLKSK